MQMAYEGDQHYSPILCGPEILCSCYVNIIVNTVLKSSWQSGHFMLVVPQWVYPETFHQYSSVRENTSMMEAYYFYFNVGYSVPKLVI